MPYRPENPLIVQSDRSMLLETMGPRFAEARDALGRFAELVKSPEYVHTYRLTPLSLWNAAASGMKVEQVVATLEAWSRFDVPPAVPVWVRDTMGRYGRLVLSRRPEGLVLEADDAALMTELRRRKHVAPMLGRRLGETAFQIEDGDRGMLKHALVREGWPVDDRAGFNDGAPLALDLAEGWTIRPYQRGAVDAFLAGGGPEGGSGVVVLPCGAGKTIVGLTALTLLGQRTLILCTNTTALRQWRDEILHRTTLTEDQVAEYSGESKEIREVTLTTYQMLTWRRSKEDEFKHFALFNAQNWGLIVYDEVHLLPAPIFRTVADLQSKRRLGLTATLVREDGKEEDVFALIGPKRYDVPWKDLEAQGWIATATCTEIRVPFDAEQRLHYATADDKDKFRLASLNQAKKAVVRELMEHHADERVLVLGLYLEQLEWMSRTWGAPLITGKTSQKKRDDLFRRFRSGEINVLLLSKVGNFSVDLPDASVAIQISGTWGSRQEEAQRLGRVLRPKARDLTAKFYTVVTRDTVEQDFAERRQLFLTEQGYAYRIESRA